MNQINLNALGQTACSAAKNAANGLEIVGGATSLIGLWEVGVPALFGGRFVKILTNMACNNKSFNQACWDSPKEALEDLALAVNVIGNALIRRHFGQDLSAIKKRKDGQTGVYRKAIFEARNEIKRHAGPSGNLQTSWTGQLPRILKQARRAAGIKNSLIQTQKGILNEASQDLHAIIHRAEAIASIGVAISEVAATTYLTYHVTNSEIARPFMPHLNQSNTKEELYFPNIGSSNESFNNSTISFENQTNAGNLANFVVTKPFSRGTQPCFQSN